MRDIIRIDVIVYLLEQVWSKNPDCRLGQLLSNVCPEYDNNLRLVEDDVLENHLHDYLFGE